MIILTFSSHVSTESLYGTNLLLPFPADWSARARSHSPASSRDLGDIQTTPPFRKQCTIIVKHHRNTTQITWNATEKQIKHHRNNMKHHRNNMKHYTNNMKHHRNNRKHHTNNMKHHRNNKKHHTNNMKHHRNNTETPQKQHKTQQKQQKTPHK